MQCQRLRNLTTGILHTEMECIYEDIEYLTGIEGIMTHELPAFVDAMEPWLRKKVTDERFWDNKFDVTHVGEFEIESMNEFEQDEMLHNMRDKNGL